MSDWRERVRPSIILVAPDGTRFEAGWQGNDIKAGKRVGKFDYPLVDGTAIQDMASEGLQFPLTLYFEGHDHDRTAWAFLQALRQRGTWAISHPVYGGLTLQPISTTLSADPVGSGNITKVETDWIEPLEPSGGKTAADLAAEIVAQIDGVSALSSEQFAGAVNAADPEAAAAAASAGTQGLSVFRASRLYGIVAGAADLQASLTQAYSGAQEALTGATIDLVGAADQFQTLLQLPALIVGDLGGKIAAFFDFASRIRFSIIPGSDAGAVAAAATSEMILGAAIAGTCLAVATSTPATREQAVQAIDDVNSLFSAIIASLDGAQNASAGNSIVSQYFSNGINFAGLARLISTTTRYLLRLVFDLKVAKRFTLARPRAPIEITITEYGDLGPDDSYLDLFIAANGLRGRDIVLLPAGREVVVYV